MTIWKLTASPDEEKGESVDLPIVSPAPFPDVFPDDGGVLLPGVSPGGLLLSGGLFGLPGLPRIARIIRRVA